MPSFAKQIKSLLLQLGAALCCEVLISDFRQLKYLLFFVCRYHSIRKRETNKQEKQKTKQMENLKCPVV